MNINQADISDYVAGRLDKQDRFRIEAALFSDELLRRDVERARRIDQAVKLKFATRRPSLCRGGH